MSKKVCVVVGAGPGNGKAFAEKYVAEGFQVVVLSRSKEKIEKIAQETNSFPLICDVTDVESINKAYQTIIDKFDRIDVLIYNAGSGVFGDFQSIDADAFASSFKVNTLGLLHWGKLVSKSMESRGNGSIGVIGATASLRGSAGAACFASAKGAQKNLCESMARFLGPKGVHVSLFIIDGVINIDDSDEKYGKKREELMRPSAIAQTVFDVSQQDKSAWTFLCDLRPFCEKW